MTDVIDRAVLAALSESVGAEFMAELIDTFKEEAPGIFEELRLALSKTDIDRFRRAAHSLKANANTFGAAGLAELAREMEIEARAGNLSTRDEVDALEEAYRDAIAALDLYKQAMVDKGSIS